MLIFCAGPVAEVMEAGADRPFYNPGSLNDRRIIITICNFVHLNGTKAERREYVRRMLKCTYRWLERPEIWESVKQLACQLVCRGTIKGEYVEGWHEFDKKYMWPQK